MPLFGAFLIALDIVCLLKLPKMIRSFDIFILLVYTIHNKQELKTKREKTHET